MPSQLHWFMYQNLTAWLSGIGLLIVVYYSSGGAYLIDPSVRALGVPQAIGLSIGILVGAWVLYDLLWRTVGARAPKVASALSVLALCAVAFGLLQLFSARAAYLHVGVLLGTVMTGNVWFVIIPSQRALVAATREGRAQDYALNLKAKTRSIHNNYMTFPLLFIMLSSHFPGTYGHPLAWVLLLVLMFAGAGVRHFMNIRFRYTTRGPWLLPLAGIVVTATVLLFVLTARPGTVGVPEASAATARTVEFAAVHDIVNRRCVACHSAHPSEPMFPVAPANVMFDTPAQIRALATRIKERAVLSRTMPFTNKTGMTDEERATLGTWCDQGAHLQ
jgi:uncharacterized membrane protein